MLCHDNSHNMRYSIDSRVDSRTLTLSPKEDLQLIELESVS